MDEPVNISIFNGTSKKGVPFRALKIVVGEYSTLIFPTKIEMIYIESILNHKAQTEFKNED